MNFETYIAKANVFLRDVAVGIGEPENKAKAGRVLRAVLHALRSRLTAEESIHLIAQLPLLIKGIYVDGWHLTQLNDQSGDFSDFLTTVKKFDGNLGDKDFSDDCKSLDMIRGVLGVLKKYVSEGEIQHLKVQLPEEIADVILN
jgi:uncharacterized protein (DUF2267 family)